MEGTRLLLAAYRSTIYPYIFSSFFTYTCNLLFGECLHDPLNSNADFMLSSFPGKIEIRVFLSQKNDRFSFGCSLGVQNDHILHRFHVSPPRRNYSNCRYTIPIDTLVFDFDMPQVSGVWQSACGQKKGFIEQECETD